MSAAEIVTLARECRAAQRAYYAVKVAPAEKRDLLIAARVAEDKLDKALAAHRDEEG